MLEQQLPIQTALMPAYYKDFQCLMGACQDTCCGGWQIEFNKKDYLAIKRADKSEELARLLSQGMVRLREKEHDNKYAEMKMDERNRCFLQSEEGLCRLQLECGEKTLPAVCQRFPRGDRYTAAAWEFSLSPACEGVLALLWGLPEGIDFIEEPLQKKDWRMFNWTTVAEAYFPPVRSLFIDVLQERSLQLRQRMLLLGLLTQQLQALDWNSEEELDRWLERGEQLLHDPVVAAQLDRLPRNRSVYLNHNFNQLVELSMGTRSFLGKELFSAIVSFEQMEQTRTPVFNGARYQELENQLEEFLGHSEYFFENLMVATAFYLNFPTLRSPEELWKSYIDLCNLYSVYRLAAICGCNQEVSQKRLFHVLAHISRAYLHNKTRIDMAQKERIETGSDTLAHMAILVGG